MIEEKVKAAGATSATIGYKGYQHASCISINHVVCHGIPGDKKLKDGDILNIDVTVIVDGWFGDTSRMYVAGKLAAQGGAADRHHPRGADGAASTSSNPAIPSATSATPSRALSKGIACPS